MARVTATTDRQKRRLYVRKVPTISASGPAFVQVGNSRWSIAADWPARVVQEDGGEIGYVLVDGQVHILVEKGEVVGLGSSLLDLIKQKYFNN